MDACSKWYAGKRTRLLTFWILGSLFFGMIAFYVNWKFGALWCVVAILGFVIVENLLMRRVDQAAPK
jgi:hypothetical protein